MGRRFLTPWTESRDAPGRWGGGSYYGERDRQEPPELPGEQPPALRPHPRVHETLAGVPRSSWQGHDGIGDVSGLGTGWGTGTGNVEVGDHWDEEPGRTGD
ncbi:MAG: hypothetical protein RL653_381 [Pseudomonadota bacterium]|jgi:hypothetical protein